MRLDSTSRQVPLDKRGYPEAGPAPSDQSRVADLIPAFFGLVSSPCINLFRSDRPKHGRTSLRASVSSDRSAQRGSRFWPGRRSQQRRSSVRQFSRALSAPKYAARENHGNPYQMFEFGGVI